MTRLRAENMAITAGDLSAYDVDLRRKIGMDLTGIACGAANIGRMEFTRQAMSTRAAVVPVTLGEGIIAGFAEAVRRIMAHIGFPAFVTSAPDVAGIAEAYERQCGLILISDDHDFIALNTLTRKVVSNSKATGTGYAWGLSLMAGGMRDKRVLVIGCGPVGCSAAEKLIELGAHVHVHDVDRVKAQRFAVEIKGRSKKLEIEDDLNAGLRRFRLILDATPAARIIPAEAIDPTTCISAPGIPIGMTPEALTKASDRVLHDFLEIGVATMAAMSLTEA
jgi:3-methylornithyl-N6-L-lysine dehydrogenase